jgi:hypothetical protein
MKEAVRTAITELEAEAPGTGVRFEEDGDGGAYVIVDGVEIGASFTPSATWIGFHITHSYPEAAVYPHYVDPTLRYSGDGPAANQHSDGNLPTAITRGDFKLGGFELAAIQVSRSSPKRAPGTDTALAKLHRVISFLETR